MVPCVHIPGIPEIVCPVVCVCGGCWWLGKINSLEPGKEKVTFWAVLCGREHSSQGNEHWSLRSTSSLSLAFVPVPGPELNMNVTCP